MLADMEPLAVVIRRTPTPLCVDRQQPVVIPLAEFMETSVPICGKYPFFGPMMFTSDSSEIASSGISGNPEHAVVKMAAVLTKVRRVGAHSNGNMKNSSEKSGRETRNDAIVSQDRYLYPRIPTTPIILPVLPFSAR